MEEFFLRGILARDELHVVDQQQVGVPQTLLEANRVIVLQRPNKLDHEFLGRHGHDARATVMGREGVADGMQQMGFSLPVPP